MASDEAGASRLTFGLGLAIRALLLAALACLAIWLYSRPGYAASATVVALIALIVTGSLFRHAARADRTLAQAVEGLAAGTLARPASDAPAELAAAIERARAQMAAERSSARNRPEYFQALCDNLPVALFVIDERYRWQAVNRAAWKLVGEDDSAGIARRLGLEAVELVQTLTSGRQTIFRLPDTGLRMLANTARWIADGEQRTLVALLPVDHLLDRVETQAWQDLARILAHEMMNSLTPITSLAASVRPMLNQVDASADRPALIADMNAAMETIERRSASLMRFVENYRSVSESLVASSQRVDLDELVERTLRLVGEQRQGGAVITHQRGAAGLQIRADPTLLEQALINLLKNARDAVANIEAPAIEVRTAVADGYASIAVRDNGVGIDPALTSRAFVPFYTTKPGGSGIGLTLARQIVLAHAGKIEIAAAAGGGTLVTMWIPVEGPA